MPVRMCTAERCSDCWRAKKFLQSNEIEFEEINIEQSQQAAKLVMEHNQGRRRVPTFEINGAFYGNPPLSELARLVGAE